MPHSSVRSPLVQGLSAPWSRLGRATRQQQNCADLGTENPTLTASERQKGLSGILPSGSPILLNLLSVLSENGRLASAPRVFADFNSLMAAYRGELEVIVTSAEALDSKSMSRLEKALKGAQLAEGKTLKINNRVSGQASLGDDIIHETQGDKADMSIGQPQRPGWSPRRLWRQDQ